MKQSEADALVPTAHANAAPIRQGLRAEFHDVDATKKGGCCRNRPCLSPVARMERSAIRDEPIS
jgi:hypothetical protein